MTEAELGAPCIVRIGGLPADAVDDFAESVTSTQFAEVRRLEAEYCELAERLTDRLFGLVPASPPEQRRFILAVKRDCFNRRTLASHREHSGWRDLVAATGGELEVLVGLEEELKVLRAYIEMSYQNDIRRERAALHRILGDPGFLHALSLASPELVANLGDLDTTKSDGEAGWRERKIERSVLRYVSRSALKLSPYSTFTKLALGRVVPPRDGSPLALVPGPWRERSVFRIKRYLLDQYREVLLRRAEFRAGIVVWLNDTLEEIAPGRFRLLRPGQLGLQEGSEEFRYTPPSLVKVSLSGPVIDWLRAEIAGSGLVYRQLAERLEGLFRQDLRPILDRLLEIGFLRFRLPWNSEVVHLEKGLLDYLRTILGVPRMRSVAERIEKLVDLEEGFAASPSPVETIRQINLLTEEIWDEIRLGDGTGSGDRFYKNDNGNFYEDVFLCRPNDAEAEGDALVHLAPEAAQEIFINVEPMAALANLFNRRYDFLHLLAAVIEHRWHSQTVVPLLDLLAVSQEHWRPFVEFDDPKQPLSAERETFNPLDLEPVRKLEDLRRQVRSGLSGCLRVLEPGRTIILREALLDLLTAVPTTYAPVVGSCVFVQRAELERDLWMVNRIFEGTGRFGSRFTVVMDDKTRNSYVRHFVQRSVIETGRGEAELLDLMFTGANTLNVHTPQTRRVLELPGERYDLPPERVLRLKDLRVRLDTGLGMPRLEDPDGVWLLPIHLSAINNTHMPVVLKFLSMFGTGEYRRGIPPACFVEDGGVTVHDRLEIGNVVLRRRRWICPLSSLPGHAARLSSCDFFVRFNLWRLDRNIPDRVFLIERIPDPKIRNYYKPQFLDLRSPLSVSLLQAALPHQGQQIELEEVLPKPEIFPRDRSGRGWAIELQLDSLALRPPEQDLVSTASAAGRRLARAHGQ